MNSIHRPLVFVALAACLATAPAAAKTFKWSSASDIPTWDIHSQNNALGNGVHAAVYESLLYYNKKFELEPVLATGWKQVSPGTMTPLQYDQAIGDLVGYMQWMAEPAQNTRIRVGVWVLLFLGVFTVIAWRLNAAFWKDIH